MSIRKLIPMAIWAAYELRTRHEMMTLGDAYVCPLKLNNVSYSRVMGACLDDVLITNLIMAWDCNELDELLIELCDAAGNKLYEDLLNEEHETLS